MLSRRRFAAGSLAFGAGLALPAAASAQNSAEDVRLMELLHELSRRQDALDPLGPIDRGGGPDAAVFRQSFTSSETTAERSLIKWALQRLARIDRMRLGAERQISYDSILADLREEAEWLRPDIVALTAVRPFNHFGGLHIDFASIVAKGGELNYASAADYRRNLDYIDAFAQVIDNAIARFREGIASGVVESQLTVRNMIAQIDALLVQPPESSPFTSPVREFPLAIPPAQQDELARLYNQSAANRIYPAYQKFRNFLADEYLPEAREAVGISAMKGGASYYRLAIRKHTTLRLDPEAIHRLGLGEVARIQNEMDGVKRALGFGGPLRDFFDHMRTSPRFHPKTRAELADGFAQAARAVDAQVPRFFDRVPKTRLEIRPYPAYREKYEAGGSYNQGSPDGRRPGTFFYNAYDLPSRFLTGITTLYLHEGAPGHHFQVSLALEDTSLPDFQRFDGNNAYVEGWALYAETLGFEMGLFKDPMQHWGTLDDEMLRAMRLVVDTGLHAKGWSRDQAIDYMLANSGMGKSDATAEVERYIAWPGQALGYKIGALTIQRLKRKAQAGLGPRFDVRQFHTVILGSGALRMSVLEAKVDRWIAALQGPA
ncbi:MAG: DUF885 domain-containing protein [Novosphingobium sp.]|uniref:DUF885 domain-containing protein n=1 Tax=Novosphingobium sp. TaxID=1874826 RepID=UPI0032BBC1EE